MDGAGTLTPAHRRLREATREAHEAAEAAPLMRRLLAGELDEAGYRRLLQAQLDLFASWESERAIWLDDIAVRAGWTFESRADALTSDLARTPTCRSAPGRDSFSRKSDRTCSARPRELSRPGALLQPSEATRSWGELYVVEGSALGGRVIVAGLRQRFPHLPHHFYGLGEATPPWRRFQSLLDRHLPDEPAQEAAIDAALAMFARFQRSLQDPSRHD